MTRPNVLLITADDLNWNSVGAYGCPVEDITPNIDRLAAEGMRFERGHVTCAVCMPSRHVLATGLYPHNNGVEGFQGKRLKPGTVTVMELLAGAGYRTGIIGKLGHSSAGYEQRWDYKLDMEDLDRGRSAELYGQRTAEFLAGCGDEPFYFMANSHDPHRPFYGSPQEAGQWPTPTPAPSRVYARDEVNIPGFLPELEEVRLEMGEYYSSVRRCDDTVGAILAALEASGRADETLVLFLSDNGMALPFAKTNCYLNSTKTPWIMRLPGVTEAGAVDDQHFVSGIDWLPTVAELCGVTVGRRVDGRSLLTLLRGDDQDGRDRVFTEFNETSGTRSFPMRCVQDGRFGYIFNAWSDGVRAFQNESMSGRTWSAMRKAGRTDRAIAARVELFEHRVREELYDFSEDPDALRNLIDDPRYAGEADRLRQQLARHLRDSDDWALEMFKLAMGDDEAGLTAAVDAKQAEITSGSRRTEAAR